jgi:hypothetical protein
MSTKPTAPVAHNIGVAATSHKVFSQGANDPPAPIYLNAVEFTGMGMDVLMDIGVVSPESVVAAMTKKKTPDALAVVDMRVHYRFGLSIQTAFQMHQKLSALLDQSTKQAEAEVKAATAANPPADPTVKG